MHSKPFKATKTTHMPLKSYAKPGKPTQRNCWLGGIHHSSQPLSTTTSKEKRPRSHMQDPSTYQGSHSLSTTTSKERSSRKIFHQFKTPHILSRHIKLDTKPVLTDHHDSAQPVHISFDPLKLAWHRTSYRLGTQKGQGTLCQSLSLAANHSPLIC